ncbi:extracellular solute-binding protein, partial [Hydrogenophaga sp.]|uniref:extracellular solute-binding protein n=1 Tax=Hydrogenophaga sp. TaxID=1904254 RepID=UPI002726A60F
MLKTLLAAALAATFLVACGPREQPAAVAPGAAPAEPRVLNIYNWPDYVPTGLIEAFEAETGIDVTYDTFASNEVLHARLVAGNTGYDIVVPGSVFAAQQIAAGFFQPLDKSKIPNLANMDPALMATLTKADPENRHLVPWAWGFTTVGINRTRLERALGNTPMPEN